MKRAAALLLLASIGCSAARSPSGAPDGLAAVAPPSAPAEIEVKLYLNTGSSILGAYSILLEFDREVAEIVEIDSSKRNRFPAEPNFNPATLASGRVMLHAASTRRVHYDGGDYHLATITFRGRRAEVTRVEASLKDCYDASRPPQPIRGTLSVLPTAELDFRNR